jgi:phosphatidylglycerol:prolipoprotein diacylglycerol transferase
LSPQTDLLKNTEEDPMNFISFPGLGITLEVDPIAFVAGPFTVRWYGIVLSLAIFSALALSLRHAPTYGVEPDRMVDMFMFALPVSVVFARLHFVLVEWDTFRNDLLGVFRIWEGGITIYGAVVGAVLTLAVYCRVRGFRFWQWLDFACVYLPFAQAIGRWGNFFNQELYGTNTNLPWGMTGSLIQAWPNPGVDGSLPVHPTFLYESLWNLLLFAVLLAYRPRSHKRGQVFGAYLFLYSVGRFGMEFIRTDVFSFGDSEFRANMVAAAVLALVGLAVFILRGFSPSQPWEPWVPAVAEATGAGTGSDAQHQDGIPSGASVDPESVEVGRSAYGDVLKSLREEEASSGEPVSSGFPVLHEGTGNDVPTDPTEATAARTEPGDEA